MAASARARQNEGQARVCARRAAGVAVREYFSRQGLDRRGTTAMDLLKELLENPASPAPARQAAEALLLRVSPDFQLPVDVDLLQAAVSLAQSLLPGEIEGL